MLPNGGVVVLHERQLGEIGAERDTTAEDRRRHQHEHPEGRVNLEAATKEKPTCANAAGLLIVAEEQTGDEEPAQHKEEIDAHPSPAMEEGQHAGRGRGLEMMDHDEQDGDCSYDVESS